MTSPAVVCDAICRRRLLELTYRGAVRLVEPYSHGVSHDGRQILVAYQRTGGSSTGQAEGWKALHVDEMDDVTVVDVPFVVNQPGYREGGYSKNLSEIRCCV